MRAAFVVAPITAPVVMVSRTVGLLWTATARAAVCSHWMSALSAMEPGSLLANATALAASAIALASAVGRLLTIGAVSVGARVLRRTSATALGKYWTALVCAEAT